VSLVELTNANAHAPLRYARDSLQRLQCSTSLDEATCRRVDDFLRERPEELLRVYKRHGSDWTYDLTFLRHLPSLRRLWIDADAGDLNDLAPLEVLPEGLVELTLDTVAYGSDKARDKPKQNAAILRRFRSLESLSICGALRDLDFLAGLPQLRSLHLWRNKLRDLRGIEHVAGLRHLELHASGARDLAPLRGLAALESLEIWDQRTMLDLAPLGDLHALASLQLVSCGKTLDLPSFAANCALRVLVIDKLATPANLAHVAAAPALRCLVLSGSPAFVDADALQALAGHPTLRELRLEYDDESEVEDIRRRYGWKVAYCNFADAGDFPD